MTRLMRLFCLVLSVFPLVVFSAFGTLAESKVAVAPELSRLKRGRPMLNLYVLDLVGADCMLLEYQGQNLFVDLGLESQRNQLSALIDWLQIKEATVFNTHPHSDHLGGIFPLTSQIKVSRFYTCFPEDEQGNAVIQDKAIAHLKDKGIEIVTVQDGDSLPMGDVQIKLMQVPNAANHNERSGVLRVQLGDASLLLTGDISLGTQGVLIRRGGLEADILKVPHHGIEKLHPGLLKAVQPAYAFYTHSKVNTERSSKSLTEAKLPFQYASNGVLHLQTDGETWYVRQLSPSSALPNQMSESSRHKLSPDH